MARFDGVLRLYKEGWLASRRRERTAMTARVVRRAGITIGVVIMAAALTRAHVNTEGLMLKSASRNGPQTRYTFSGSFEYSFQSHEYTFVATYEATVKAAWDPLTKEATEHISYQRDKKEGGELAASFTCEGSDPFLAMPGAWPKCHQTNLQMVVNENTGGKYWDKILAEHPLAFRRADPAVAHGMMAKSSSSNPPPPPPAPAPSTNPLRRPSEAPLRATPISIEAESLIGSAKTTSGKVSMQDMRPFGPGWSGGSQLFWAVTEIGAELRLPFPVSAAGRYDIFLDFTRAPDFALVRASVDGAPPVSFNGYATVVTRDRALLGMRDLTPGAHEVLVKVTMKDGQSHGLNVGLDRIELNPAK
jgi:hypothetical protein